MTLRAYLFLWLLVLAGAAFADDPVTIQPDSCFADMAPRGGVYPIAVSLHNSGPSADGVLVVKSVSYSDVLRSYAYPVSLPTGTDKEIVVYPALAPYTDRVSFSYQGTARAKDIDLPLTDREGEQVGMVGDEAGALSTLRLAPTAIAEPGTHPLPAAHFTDCYARPEDAPDRAAGYQSLSVLVLAAGAERLRPEQWAAIRHWVLDGGSLILLGGAGAAYLHDPEAASLLPLASLQEEALPSLTLPPAVLHQPLPGGAVSAISGKPGPGCVTLAVQNGHVVLSRQARGAGTVLLVGFNPLEQPFRGWGGKHALWLGLLHQAAATVPAWSLRQWNDQQASFTEDRSTPPGYGGTRVISSNTVNPFRLKLPPIKIIAWLFLAYFVLVIPVTYVVLKRLGRLEWAWVTSPLISIAFAYLFYLFTAQLYSAGMSRRTAGVIVAMAGDPSAQFDGFSEMFFPRGGSYRVQIADAEALELSPFSSSDGSGYAYYSGPSGGTQLQPLETVDEGDVSAPDFQMGNLAFRRLYHTESVLLGGAVTTTLTRSAEGILTGTVRNGTGQTLADCFVSEPGRGVSETVGDLAPGESRAVGLPGSVGPDVLQNSPLFQRGGGPIPSAARGVFVVARTSGAAFGPTALGRDVGGPQSITVLVSVPVTGDKMP